METKTAHTADIQSRFEDWYIEDYLDPGHRELARKRKDSLFRKWVAPGKPIDGLYRDMEIQCAWRAFTAQAALITQLTTERDAAVKALQPDMFWPEGDEESAFTSEQDLVEHISYDMQYQDETVCKVQCASQLPNRTIHVKFVNEVPVWEWVDDSAIANTGSET